MSEQDARERRAIQKRVRHDQHTIERAGGVRHSPSSKQVIHITEAERATRRDLELSIKLRESTVEELRSLSWQYLTKSGNDRTWDQAIMFLIKSYYRSKGSNKNSNIQDR
jgi:hypothetical protein